VFGNLTELTFLLFQENDFSGPLPLLVGDFPRLASVYFGYNAFTGTIPATLGYLTTTNYLDLDANQFYSTIPESFAQLKELLFLGYRSNQITGTVPDFYGGYSHIQYFYFDHNQHTGTLPDNIGGLESLRFLQAQYNYLTGTIPASLGGMREMRFLYIDNNYFSGSIPTTMSQLKFLNSFLAQSNRLTGSLTGVFNHTSQLAITAIQVSSNQLTGTIPGEIFQLPRLNAFVAVSNCFHGTLPDEMCDAKELSTLAMDGLRTASSCRQYMMPSVSSAYRLSSRFHGTFPGCLLQLRKLNTLHLSGNGLTGTLPNNLNISDSLNDLSLSHNILSGRIPETIQRRLWYSLDLSYNQFSYEMNGDFFSERRNFTFSLHRDGLAINTTVDAQHTSLYLQNNRLSGPIPDAVRDIKNISILAGNLFACLYDKSDLPRHDQRGNTYECGSNSFNIPYFIWLSIASAIVLAVAVGYAYRHEVDKFFSVTVTMVQFREWLMMTDVSANRSVKLQMQLRNICHVWLVGDVICKVSVICAIFAVIILLPFYGTITLAHGTHLHEYAFTVSMIFTKGHLAFGLALALLCLLMICMVYGFVYFVKRFDLKRLELLEDKKDHIVLISNVEQQVVANGRDIVLQEASQFERISVCVAFFLISGTVVLGVNVAFVYVALYQSTVLLILAQMMLSVFKVIWNLLCAPYLIRWTSNYLSSEATAHRRASRTGFFSLQLFVSLFNNIAIPCLVVGAIDPNCFYDIFVPANTETSSFIYAECADYGVLGCVSLLPAVSSSTFRPPFTYSFQCSSSFITYYAPSFLYMCFVATFFSPLAQILGHKLHAILPRGSLLFRGLDRLLPQMLKPVDMEKTNIRREVFHPIFDANLVLISLLTYLGILLTFGAVFPPLGCALAVTVLAVAYFERLKIGRFIALVLECGKVEYLGIIEIESQGMGSVDKMYHAIWMLVMFSFVFYAMFLFDTLGDTVGVEKAGWVLLAVPITPFMLYFVASQRRQAREDRANAETEMIEMRTTLSTAPVSLSQAATPESIERDPRDSRALHRPTESATFNVLQQAALPSEP
jgi:Leucine-rich repeat (LRR) protein